MSDWEIVEWRGLSGNAYLYTSVPIGARLSDEPGNYIFTRLDERGFWVALYVGETDSLENRVHSGHESFRCVHEQGGTHVHFRRNTLGEAARKEERDDIMVRWQPPCNEPRGES